MSQMKVRSELVRLRIYPIAVALGASVGLLASVFIWGVVHLKHLLWERAQWNYSGITTFSICLCGGLIVGLLNFARSEQQSRAHDLDQALAEVNEIEKATLPSAISVIRRAILGITSLGFGGPLGPEAPLIEIATQMSSRLASVLRIAKSDAVQISLAGSLGALFGAPLAIATQEPSDSPSEISRLRRIQLFGPEILAGVVAFVTFSKLLPGNGLHAFHGATVTDGFGSGQTWILLTLAAVAATIAALVAQILIPKVREVTNRYVPGKGIGAGLLSGAILGGVAASNPMVLFSGHHEIQQLLDEKHDVGFLLFIAALKMFVLVVCLSAGWFGGQIFPMAFIGAATTLALGATVSSTASLALAAVGFAAAIAVGTRKPLLSLIFGLLFFPAQTWLPMLLAVAIATSFANHFSDKPAH